MSTGRRLLGDKETWWWNDEVKDVIRATKEAKKKKWEASGRQEDRDIYRQANKKANKEVVRAKAHAMDEVYNELETPEGERKIYRIEKGRVKSAKDFTQIRQIKDEQGVVLWEHDKIIERLRYYGKLLNEENPRTVFGDGVPDEGLTPAINRKEVAVALKGMKHGKAMGPDVIPVELWKSLGEEGVDMLLDLLQKIFEQDPCLRNGGTV